MARYADPVVSRGVVMKRVSLSTPARRRITAASVQMKELGERVQKVKRGTPTCLTEGETKMLEQKKQKLDDKGVGIVRATRLRDGINEILNEHAPQFGTNYL